MESTFDTGMGRAQRNTTVLIVIVAFHVLLVWALVNSLSTIPLELPPMIIQADIIEEITQEDEAPPPPPALETPPPYVPPPEFTVDVPQSTAPTKALTATQSTRPAPPPPVKKVVKKAPEIDPKFRRRFQPDYPPTSRRLGEEGSVVLQVLVGPDGKVREGKIKTSSGFSRLDEAALKHALRAWRFTPGTEDGAPVTVWHSVRVTFKIEG